MYKKAIMMFTRDLRLVDNTALNSIQAQQVIPIFIFNPKQIEQKNNPYFGSHVVQFMLESLNDLDEQLQKHKSKLHFFYGEPTTILQELIRKHTINAIYINKDYTPFSQKREHDIHALCQKENVAFHSYDDTLLHPPGTILKQDRTPYTVFTPFYKYASTLQIKYPHPNQKIPFSTIESQEKEKLFSQILPEPKKLAIKGGRTHAKKQLQFIKELSNYKQDRDALDKQGTTYLSAYHKFGTISVRETLQACQGNEPLIRQLFWRDFFYHIAFHFPHVFQHAFQKKYTDISWENNKNYFEKWCAGKTGFPIIDAAMNQLNQTGYMHNRARMIVASFLTKDLLIDWRWGEKYFAQTLIDYDPCVNNGSWQWAASTGCDAQPYFRIFNPWLQQEKFDPECTYIKKWLPELQNYNPKQIHQHQKIPLTNYPEPIVDHYEQKNKALALFKKA
ncbi:MAG: cryptochrome/photolyase family protein [Candidatus Woesearchaeota archaeon]